VPALGRSGVLEFVLRAAVRGRPRGLRLGLLTLRAAFSLTGKWALFISRVVESSFQAIRLTAFGRCSEKGACPRRVSPSLSCVMANRKLGCLTLFLFLALCASVLVNIFLVFGLIGRFSSRGFVREEVPPRFRELMVQAGAHGSRDRVVVILMRGLISTSVPGNASDNMVDDMRLALQQARDDDRVKAVVLEVDSPGGEITAADIIYNAVAKTRAKKPVVIYMDSLAASGGYYVSCGGKYLMANDTTITGSIGVIIQTLNYEQLFNKVGLASIVFKSGKFKDLLNGARPMTPEERDFVQAFVMKSYDKFLGIVAKERNLSADALRNSIADGRILSGKEALENKLIDGVGQIEDAYAKARQLADAPDAHVVRYAAPFSFGRFFRALGETGKLQIELPRQLVPQLESGRAYYLPSFYAP
jgi:protease-4